MLEQQVESGFFQVLDALNHAFREKNVDAVVSLFDSKLELSFVGSEPFEHANNSEQLRSVLSTIFARNHSYSWDWKTVRTMTFARTAWLTVDANIVVAGKKVERYPYRITMVLVKRRGKWFMVQFHGSEPTSE
jgi:hypothetical protein